jgi:glycosyltransferase involved in cell wall biosynthesis
MPFFSVIIPSYNRGHIIVRAIESVLNQSYSDFEIIVVDDGSIDETRTVISSQNDPRISYLFQQNKGVCTARNLGASKAKGDYLVFLDSDDYVAKEWLMDFYHAISEKAPDIVRCRKADENVVDNNSYKGFLSGSFTIRKEVFYKVGMYDENLHYGENTELKWRIDFGKYTTIIINKQNLFYDATFSLGGGNKENKIRFFYYIIEKHQTYFNKNRSLSQLLYQVTGVTCFQLGSIREGMRLLWLGYLKNPLKLKALGRVVFYTFKLLNFKRT